MTSDVLSEPAVWAGAPERRGVLVVIGTRPEAVKLAPVLSALGARARLLHTGQHFDTHLWSAVATDLHLPPITERVTVGGLSRGEQIGAAVSGITRLLQVRPAEAVIVLGDTNSALGGALAANASRTPLVHVEAGLRSDDRTAPEEANRMLIDRISDVCCVPGPAEAERLGREGIALERIRRTGSTLTESVRTLLPDPAGQARVLAAHRVEDQGYVLATLHREATVEDPTRLAAVLRALGDQAARSRVLLAMHPRTWTTTSLFGLTALLETIQVVEPLPPRVFLALEARAGLIVSDSCTVQEEAALLGVPLVVARRHTERPDLVPTWGRLAGDEPIGEVVRQAWADAPAWRREIVAAGSPYPALGAGARVVSALADLLAG